MAVQLLIRDGAPHWWASPDIWVVPGADPSGPPGTPIAGQTAYLWAHIANNGSTAANGVRVDFYWANPALQVTRSNATLIGSAFADVPAGGSQDALCLVPWVPVIVNDGHECVVAVANHAGHPLPNPLPDAFDPPTYPQVAQKNLTVLVARMATMSLTVAGWRRRDKKVLLAVEVGGELDERTLAGLGLHKMRPARTGRVEAGLERERRCHDEKDPVGERRIEVHVPAGSNAAVHLTVRADGLAASEYGLVRVEELLGDTPIGGFGVVIVPQKPASKERAS